MPTFELKAFGTDMNYADDVRYRTFTTSATKAEQFGKIRRIDFSDSGHGIVFAAVELKYGDRRKKEVRGSYSQADYVEKELRRIKAEEKLPEEVQALIFAARHLVGRAGPPSDDVLTNPPREVEGDNYDRLHAAVEALG